LNDLSAIFFSVIQDNLFQRFPAIQAGRTQRGLPGLAFRADHRDFHPAELAKFPQERGFLAFWTSGIQKQSTVAAPLPVSLNGSMALGTGERPQWIIFTANRAKIRFFHNVGIAITAGVFVSRHCRLLFLLLRTGDDWQPR
jgi:hypothetical protein